MLLQTQNLSKSFGGLEAVKNVSFSLEQGQVHAIIGPNGAGKTTFVSLLSGRVQPTEGTVVFADSDITNLAAWQRVRRGIAYTFQITSIYPALSVFDNVAIAAQPGAQKSDSQEIRKIAHSCLDKVGLADLENAKAGELAYGHQRLLEIAMGLALNPKLLILDEPTQGLSDAEIAEFIELIATLRKRMTILIIEHNMPVVMAIADQITVLDQGQILDHGSVEKIQNSAAVQEAYLGG